MSLTAVIKCVPITDEEAIKSAIAALKERGIDCECLTGVAPRMYYDNQFAKSDLARRLKKKVAEYVLKLNAAPFDVGFVLGEDGTYAPVADLHANHIKDQIGAKGKVEGASAQEEAIGQFLQLYSEHAAKNAAANAGWMVEDSTVDEYGNTRVTIQVPDEY